VYPGPVTLAEAETRFTPRPPEPPADDAPVRSCESCGAGLAAGQNWCLECGAAAPGRLGPQPGRRALATVSTFTVLLLAGAGVASYAAVSGGGGRHVVASAPPPANAIAQAPPTVTTPPPATTPAPPPAATTPAKPLPKVAPPATTPAVTAKPVVPAKPVTTTPSKPTTTTHAQHAAPRTGPTTTSRVALDPSSGSLYDPYGRASAKGDPTHALDGNPSTSWFVTVGTPDEMGVGYVVDIPSPVSVQSVLLFTHTEGFDVEVYGTGSTSLPPNVLDPHWIHLATRTNVDASQPGIKAPDGNVAGDGKERIALSSGAKRFRHLLLWFTQPPETGQTVRLSELQLFT
jgi:hypothetical protein